MKQNNRLKSFGNYILVTGATSGIGRTISDELAATGIDLVLVARDQKLLDRLVVEYKTRYGIDALAIDADLSVEEQVIKLFEQTEKLDIGVCIHSAGFGSSGYFLNNELANETNMVHLNCVSTLSFAYEFGKRFKQRGKGALVLFSSIVAFQGVPYSANYAATKAYVQTLGEALVRELRSYNVNVLVAAPGPTQTGFSERANMDMKGAMKPREVAKDIIKNIGKSRTIYPGVLSKVLTFSLNLLPRFGKIKVMTGIMKKMAQA
ncbi:MAG: SDR family NAD(P)-dependent oxidoreductase [Bacteroidota bacterium]